MITLFRTFFPQAQQICFLPIFRAWIYRSKRFVHEIFATSYPVLDSSHPGCRPFVLNQNHAVHAGITNIILFSISRNGSHLLSSTSCHRDLKLSDLYPRKICSSQGAVSSSHSLSPHHPLFILSIEVLGSPIVEPDKGHISFLGSVSQTPRSTFRDTSHLPFLILLISSHPSHQPESSA